MGLKMRMEIEVEGRGKAVAEIDERSPDAAREIWSKLPIEGSANIWQEEVYFEIPVEIGYENKSPTASKGDMSYWPPGNAFCIFYGKTQPYSEVNHIGKVIENLGMFEEVREGDKVILRAAEGTREINKKKGLQDEKPS